MKNLIKKPPYRYKNFTTDLQNYLALRVIILIIAVFVGIGFGIFVKNVDLIIFYYFISACCLIWLIYVYLMGVYDQIYVYEGICEKKNLNKVSIPTTIIRKNKFDVYGKCNATMIINITNNDGSISEAKFIVPIGYKYDLEEGNVIKVYAFPNSVFPHSENSFIITNPLMIKVAKI